MTNTAILPAEKRGESHTYWLDSRHSFSFADFYNPAQMGFRTLRVINEDWVAPKSGFNTHPHRDMEIITYVMEGALAHKDSLGTGATIHPGEIQRMSAGTGIEHSEFNASESEPVHLLQIWILPAKRGGEPSYAQETINAASVTGRFGLIASQNGRDGSITLGQDADLWLAKLKKGETATFALRDKRGAWVQVVRGAIALDGASMKAGDGASRESAGTLTVIAAEDSEVLLFDLA